MNEVGGGGRAGRPFDFALRWRLPERAQFLTLDYAIQQTRAGSIAGRPAKSWRMRTAVVVIDLNAVRKAARGRYSDGVPSTGKRARSAPTAVAERSSGKAGFWRAQVLTLC